MLDVTLPSDATSLEELEGRWRRVESLTATRDWINGATLLLLVVLMGWGYRDLAWALWTLLVWTSAMILAASMVLRLVGLQRTGHAIGFWLGLAAGAFGVLVGVGILGALLSFFAENEPAALLGRNGFINADTTAVLAHTSARYAPVLLLAVNELIFAVRIGLHTHAPASARLGGYVARMVGAVIVSAFVGVALAGLFSPAIAEVGLGLFYLGWFAFPWRRLSKDSVEDQMAEGRPALYAGRALPLEFTERAAPAMVIIALVLALMFGGFGSTLVALSVRQLRTQGVSLAAAVLLLISLALLGVFAFLALLTFTLSRATKRVSIGVARVTVEERTWSSADETSWRGRLAATFGGRVFQADLREYTHLQRRLERYKSSDGPDYDEHELVMAHRADRKKDIVIYRACHDRHLDMIHRHYAGLLRLPLSGPTAAQSDRR